jgi:hypothetical protein
MCYPCKKGAKKMENKRLYSVAVVKGVWCSKFYYRLTLEKAREIAMKPGVRAVCLVEGGVS